ncbi:MAG: hypothetical protein H5T64_10890 [Chloroflexi bacterium]|nr:hypothetical protein [Chloroflexota bacterium]
MTKRICILAAVAVLASLVLVSVANAEDLEGTGRLWARGVGVATVHGDGRVVVWCRGFGTVWVKGAENLEARGVGIRREVDGGVLFVGWRGRVTASGHELTVRMAGGVIEFVAEGTGWATLKGRGRYRIGGASGNWSADGITIHFSP